VLKVIVANPTMINAYKAGIPGNGQPFPDGSKIAKLQWKPKKSTEAPFAVDVPDVFTQAFVIEKDSKRFPNSGGWGYALFNYDAASDKFTADPSPSDCGHACHVAVKAKDHIFHPYQKRWCADHWLCITTDADRRKSVQGCGLPKERSAEPRNSPLLFHRIARNNSLSDRRRAGSVESWR
jgi:hypothetical protein